MGTRREVAVKPSYGTGHPGTGSNAGTAFRPGQTPTANVNDEVRGQARRMSETGPPNSPRWSGPLSQE